MGSVILTLKSQGGGAAAPSKAPAAEGKPVTPGERAEAATTRSEPAESREAPPKIEPPSSSTDKPEPPSDFSGVHAGPSVRRLARELGVDLTKISGKRRKRPHHQGRPENVACRQPAAAREAAAPGLPDVPVVDHAKFGPIETKPLSRIKKISGPRLHASWVNIPHVTHTDEADITELEAFRKSLDEAAKVDKKAPYRVSLLPLLMKASVATLKTYPTFNSALSPAKDALINRLYWNIGVAVDTPDGLVVAVVKDVDKKGVIEVAKRAWRAFVQGARRQAEPV